MLPSAVSAVLLKTLLHREELSGLLAFYNRCWTSAIDNAMSEWSSVEIRSMWYGAGYFNFLRPLQAVYIEYEEWIRLRGYENLAPYYLLDPTR